MEYLKKNKDGYEIELKGHDSKKLNHLIDTVCKRTGQNRPHKIILTEGTEVAVTGFFKKKIIIGMVALKYTTEEELLAILTHEYGHFANNDTLLGYLTYRIQHFIEVQKEINRQSLSLSFTLVVYFPTWLFFWLLSRYFLLISLWYSRRVEFRADNFASTFVGQQKFADSLVKYCIISDIFDSVVPEHVLHFLKQNRQIVNVYHYIKPIYSGENIKHCFNAVLSAKSSWWSTHPSISERLEMLGIKKLDIAFETNLKDILENQEKYEKEASEIMTYKLDYWLKLTTSVQQGHEEEN